MDGQASTCAEPLIVQFRQLREGVWGNQVPGQPGEVRACSEHRAAAPVSGWQLVCQALITAVVTWVCLQSGEPIASKPGLSCPVANIKLPSD